MLHIQPFTFNPFQENTYVIYNDRNSCLIIDPGCSSPGEREILTAFIRQKRLQPRLLINTHCHIDHVLGLEFIYRNYGLALHMHAADQPVLDHAPAAGLMFGVPFENFSGPVNYLEDESKVSLDDDEFKIIFTPGHSPGSISLYNETQGFLICGDILFSRSIGRTDLPGGDFDTLITSIRNRLFVLPDHTKVYSGHGPSTTIGEEKRENPFLID